MSINISQTSFWSVWQHLFSLPLIYSYTYTYIPTLSHTLKLKKRRRRKKDKKKGRQRRERKRAKRGRRGEEREERGRNPIKAPMKLFDDQTRTSECSNSRVINICCLYKDLRKFGHEVYVKQNSFENTAWFLRRRQSWIDSVFELIQQSIDSCLSLNWFIIQSINVEFESIHQWINSCQILFNRFSFYLNRFSWGKMLKFSFVSDYAYLIVQIGHWLLFTNT